MTAGSKTENRGQASLVLSVACYETGNCIHTVMLVLRLNVQSRGKSLLAGTEIKASALWIGQP